MAIDILHFVEDSESNKKHYATLVQCYKKRRALLGKLPQYSIDEALRDVTWASYFDIKHPMHKVLHDDQSPLKDSINKLSHALKKPGHPFNCQWEEALHYQKPKEIEERILQEDLDDPNVKSMLAIKILELVKLSEAKDIQHNQTDIAYSHFLLYRLAIAVNNIDEALSILTTMLDTYELSAHNLSVLYSYRAQLYYDELHNTDAAFADLITAAQYNIDVLSIHINPTMKSIFMHDAFDIFFLLAKIATRAFENKDLYKVIEQAQATEPKKHTLDFDEAYANDTNSNDPAKILHLEKCIIEQDGLFAKSRYYTNYATSLMQMYEAIARYYYYPAAIIAETLIIDFFFPKASHLEKNMAAAHYLARASAYSILGHYASMKRDAEEGNKLNPNEPLFLYLIANYFIYKSESATKKNKDIYQNRAKEFIKQAQRITPTQDTIFSLLSPQIQNMVPSITASNHKKSSNLRTTLQKDDNNTASPSTPVKKYNNTTSTQTINHANTASSDISSKSYPHNVTSIFANTSINCTPAATKLSFQGPQNLIISLEKLLSLPSSITKKIDEKDGRRTCTLTGNDKVFANQVFSDKALKLLINFKAEKLTANASKPAPETETTSTLAHTASSKKEALSLDESQQAAWREALYHYVFYDATPAQIRIEWKADKRLFQIHFIDYVWKVNCSKDNGAKSGRAMTKEQALTFRINDEFLLKLYKRLVKYIRKNNDDTIVQLISNPSMHLTIQPFSPTCMISKAFRDAIANQLQPYAIHNAQTTPLSKSASPAPKRALNQETTTDAKSAIQKITLDEVKNYLCMIVADVFPDQAFGYLLEQECKSKNRIKLACMLNNVTHLHGDPLSFLTTLEATLNHFQADFMIVRPGIKPGEMLIFLPLAADAFKSLMADKNKLCAYFKAQVDTLPAQLLPDSLSLDKPSILHMGIFQQTSIAPLKALAENEIHTHATHYLSEINALLQLKPHDDDNIYTQALLLNTIRLLEAYARLQMEPDKSVLPIRNLLVHHTFHLNNAVLKQYLVELNKILLKSFDDNRCPQRPYSLDLSKWKENLDTLCFNYPYQLGDYLGEINKALCFIANIYNAEPQLNNLSPLKLAALKMSLAKIGECYNQIHTSHHAFLSSCTPAFKFFLRTCAKAIRNRLYHAQNVDIYCEPENSIVFTAAKQAVQQMHTFIAESTQGHQGSLSENKPNACP